MASSSSFDIVSKANYQEIDNAIHQSMQEIQNRFDFKGSISNIKRENDNLITIISEDDFKLNSVLDILKNKLIKRAVSLKFLKYGKIDNATGGNVKQTITIQEGIDKDKAKEINKLIKDSKEKVQSQIQADQLRVSAKSKDALQNVIQLLKKQDFDIELQFINFR